MHNVFRLTDFVVESTMGQSQSSINIFTERRRLYYNILDHCLGEIAARFNERNIKVAISCLSSNFPYVVFLHISSIVQIVKALRALLPTSGESFLQPTSLNDLSCLINMNCSSSQFSSECIVMKTFLTTKLEKLSAEVDLSQIVQIVSKNRDAFPQLHTLYSAALTFAASTASCEASFSTLSRVLTPYRMSMTHTRKSNLVILSFDATYTNAICMDEFVRECSKSSRKIQLF